MKCGRVHVGQLVTIDGSQTPAIVVQVNETQALVWFDCDTSNAGMTQWWGFDWLLPRDSAADSDARARELQWPDGTPAGVFVCKECKTWAHGSASMAEACCAPRNCPGCGVEVSRLYTVCSTCTATKTRASEAARFEAATKVALADYAGVMVYVEDDDEYVATRELDDRLAEREGGPPRVYATTPTQPYIDADHAIESALDDSFEGAYEAVGTEATRELAAYVKQWSELHLPVSYFQDAGTAVVVETEQGEGEPCKAC